MLTSGAWLTNCARMCVALGTSFWQSIRGQVDAFTGLAGSDRVVLEELCGHQGWIDKIPPGLVMSYSYLYQCVRGVGSSDAQIIERCVCVWSSACVAVVLIFMC
jgi:hypothetical protein